LHEQTGLLDEWLGHTRAGELNESQIGRQEVEATPRHEGAVTCSYTPFYDQNVVLPNGDVYLCCMDYSLKHRMGNLFEQDYYSLFGSVGALVAENVKLGHHHRSLCKSCPRARPHAIEANWQQCWVA
jgi:radical SAM protein with 4Fe4S-binding SPASM domain